MKQFIMLNGKQMILGMLVKIIPNPEKPQEGKLQIFTVASPWENGRSRISMIQREAYTEPSYILRIDTIANYSEKGIDWLFDPKKLYLEMQRIIVWCNQYPEAVILARTTIALAIDQALEDPQVGPKGSVV